MEIGLNFGDHDRSKTKSNRLSRVFCAVKQLLSDSHRVLLCS